MPSQQFSGILGEWKGYRVLSARRLEADPVHPRPRVLIFLGPLAERPLRCPHCGREVPATHDVEIRWVRDLPILDADTWLQVPRRRLVCPQCGPRREELEWLPLYARVTRRLAVSVARLCEGTTIRYTARFYHLNWKTVRKIDKAYLQESLGPLDLSGIEVLGLDEFAIHKGHRYATIFVDAVRKRVLWVCRGHGRKDIRQFFLLLGRERCGQIKAIVMDMNGAYQRECQARCPQAEIVFDLFHVVAKYGREVIDRVRVDEANRLRKDKTARKIVKSARWILLRNKDTLSFQEQVRLREIQQANQALLTVSVLKDDLKHLWDYRRRWAAERFWKGWYGRALSSRLEPLKRFARRLQDYVEGILAHCRWPFHTSLLEGINNKIKVIKRKAYGFHDDEYFFLKIRAAFPGNGR